MKRVKGGAEVMFLITVIAFVISKWRTYNMKREGRAIESQIRNNT